MKTTMLLCALLALTACHREPEATLQPFQARLNQMAKQLHVPDEATQKELRDLADIALQLVESDARTAALSERALLDHQDLAWVLEPALTHDQLPVRRRAAWLCGQSGQVLLQFPLLMRLKYETDGETIIWVADALQRLGNDTGLAWLGSAMNSEKVAEQAGTLAIGILKERGIDLTAQPTYVELQSKLQQLTDEWLRTGVRKGFQPKPPDPSQLEARIAAHLAVAEGTALRPVDDARYVLTRCGVLAVPMLVRTLGASESYLRTLSLQILGELRTAANAAGDAVLPLLGDPLTVAYAMRTLGEIGATKAVPQLRLHITDPDTELRAAAAHALGLLHDVDSAPLLRQRMDDNIEQMDVRVDAAFALLCFGKDDAAEAFLKQRESNGDYHAPMLARLRDRLAMLPR